MPGISLSIKNTMKAKQTHHTCHRAYNLIGGDTLTTQSPNKCALINCNECNEGKVHKEVRELSSIKKNEL